LQVKQKNPWVAAILNFFFPGIGFIYLGTTLFIIVGVILFSIELFLSIVLFPLLFTPIVLSASLMGSVFWAALGYVAAEHVNKQLMVVHGQETMRYPPATSQPTWIYCPYCGAPNFPDASFCQRCGQPLKASQQQGL